MAAKPEKPLRVSVWARYEEELAPIASRLPANARKYALAPWHCDLTDHRCIHDATVEAISVVEAGSGPRNKPDGYSMGIVIRLLGAHQDRRLLLKFPRVRRYILQHPSPDSTRQNEGHGEVIDDSIRLTPDGHVLYSLHMEGGSLEIEAKDIEFSQQPV